MVERTGSGDFSQFDVTTNVVYHISEKPYSEVEELFKTKYPIQYAQARKKFEKKIRKLLKANEENM